MRDFVLALLVILLVTITLIGWVVYLPRKKKLRRQRVFSQVFPKPWRHLLRDKVPVYSLLPADLQLQLKRHIQVFLDEKEFVGCEGLEITDEIRVSIAAQACLLLLNRPVNYFANCRSVYVYPAAFVTRHAFHENGVEHLHRRVLSGESWEKGRVVISWQDSVSGARDPFDGHNVVIHEFAHQLDQENGAANGYPILGENNSAMQWSRILSAEFERLGKAIETNKPHFFNDYSATSPAEFFAVATEHFFEQPAAFFEYAPELFAELTQFYSVNPRSWR